jgi:hypothetical protein
MTPRRSTNHSGEFRHFWPRFSRRFIPVRFPVGAAAAPAPPPPFARPLRVAPLVRVGCVLGARRACFRASGVSSRRGRAAPPVLERLCPRVVAVLGFDERVLGRDLLAI